MIEFELGGPATRLVLRYTQGVMTQLAQVVVCDLHYSLERRLCRFLLSTLDRLGGDSEFLMTQDLMGDVLGVRRESVTEGASNLQRAGLLHYERGHITVLDRAGLERRSCEFYAVVKREYERLLPAASVQWRLDGLAPGGAPLQRYAGATLGSSRSHSRLTTS